MLRFKLNTYVVGRVAKVLGIISTWVCVCVCVYICVSDRATIFSFFFYLLVDFSSCSYRINTIFSLPYLWIHFNCGLFFIFSLCTRRYRTMAVGISDSFAFYSISWCFFPDLTVNEAPAIQKYTIINIDLIIFFGNIISSMRIIECARACVFEHSFQTRNWKKKKEIFLFFSINIYLFKTSFTIEKN